MLTIAIDAMGGDKGLKATIPGAIRALKNNENLSLILVGQENEILSKLNRYKKKYDDRIRVQQADEIVGMDESPASAYRHKKNSSMRVAIQLVKSGEAQACVSAGNTGALLLIATSVLKTLPGVARPAISAVLPTYKVDHSVRMLDLGANVECTPENLVQFALMGMVVAEAELGRSPEVALLNVGAEEIKGNKLVKAAAAHLEQLTDLHYIGYVEGNDIYKGVADVVVCDGFSGNVVLKATEGATKMVSRYVKEEFKRDVYSRIVAALAIPIFSRLRKRVDPARYNGASFLGLQGIVIKSHGSANAIAFESAINTAIRYVNKDITQVIGSKVEELLQSRSE